MSGSTAGLIYMMESNEMTISIAIFLILIAFTWYARKKAGGHLTPISHRMSTIEPRYWQTIEQRQSMELWQKCGQTSLWLAIAALIVIFVEWVRL